MAAMEKTDVPGVYKRGGRYAFSYRKRGRQHWGSAPTKAEARRLKRNAETDVERGEHRDSARVTFGTYARDWIEHYQGRTSRGFRESTRRGYRRMLEQRLIPYFDTERELRLTQIEPRDVKALVRWLAEWSDTKARRVSGRHQVLEALAGLEGRASQSQLVRELGLDRQTLRRHCEALEQEGKLRRDGFDKSGSHRGSRVWRLVSPNLALGQSGPRGGQLSRSMIRGHIAVLRAMFADAVEEGVLRSNPAAGVRIAIDGRSPGPEPCVRRPLARDELRCFLAEVAPEWRLFFELLAQTGVRIGEALELRAGRDLKLGARPRLEVRWQHVNGEVCRPKSRYGCRDIPLSPSIAQRLWQLGRRDGELLFTTSVGTRINRHNLARDVLKPTARRAGVPWATLHTFRHTCASLLFAAGKNPKQVQEWLGHHDAAFTLRTYVHLLEDGVGDAGFFDAIVQLDTCADAASLPALEPGEGRRALREALL